MRTCRGARCARRPPPRAFVADALVVVGVAFAGSPDRLWALPGASPERWGATVGLTAAVLPLRRRAPLIMLAAIFALWATPSTRILRAIRRFQFVATLRDRTRAVVLGYEAAVAVPGDATSDS